MKEHFSQFNNFTPEEDRSEDADPNIAALQLAEERVRERSEAFAEIHGSRPSHAELEKILVGVRSVLQIDLREAETDKQKVVIEEAIKRIESDQALNDVRAFFEQYERRSKPRN